MTIKEKCSQYWNEPNIPIKEMHAVLVWIHDNFDAAIEAARAEDKMGNDIHAKDAEIARLRADKEIYRIAQEKAAIAFDEEHAEIVRLTKLLCGATCVYCGFIAEPKVLTQDIGDDILKAHIAGCEKHPLTQARKQIATLQSKLEATERELIVYKGGHALDGGTLASLWAERDALRTALSASQENVRAMTRAICEAAIVIEALEIAERGGTALCPEMQTQITTAANGMRAALARPTVIYGTSSHGGDMNTTTDGMKQSLDAAIDRHHIAILEAALLRAEDAAKKAMDLFYEIRCDWSNPKGDCREGMKILYEVVNDPIIIALKNQLQPKEG